MKLDICKYSREKKPQGRETVATIIVKNAGEFCEKKSLRGHENHHLCFTAREADVLRGKTNPQLTQEVSDRGENGNPLFDSVPCSQVHLIMANHLKGVIKKGGNGQGILSSYYCEDCDRKIFPPF